MSLIFRIRLPRKNVRRGTENRRMIFPSGHGIMGRKRKNGARLSGNGGYGQKMERWIWGWLAVINIVTFLAYGLDKWKARHHRWRISEGMLLFLAAAGRERRGAACHVRIPPQDEAQKVYGGRTGDPLRADCPGDGGDVMVTIRCVVERITYQNPENGYSVLKVRVKGYQDLVPVVGPLADAVVGSVLLIEGNWKIDARYGRQFAAVRWEETVPATVYGIEKYLGSGLIKGIGPKFAKKIVGQFGTDTISVIEERPEALLEVAGIGRKRVERIRESWERQKEIKNIMLFLQSHDVSTAFAVKIYKTYGNQSIEMVKENPYRLADDIWGIGFKTADKIAEKLGIGRDDPMRCRSGVQYTLNALADEGHVYALREQLVKKAVSLLETDEEAVRSALDEMLEREELKVDGDAIYPAALLLCGVRDRVQASPAGGSAGTDPCGGQL